MPSNATADDNGDSLFNATAVAIDKDKNSQHAFRWAVDNFARSNPVIVLIHVKHKNHQYKVADGDQADEAEEVQQLFTSSRGYCARKGVRLKQVALDHIDVAQAVADYINSSLIGNIVLGASGRNVLTRRFKNQDVPTSLMKIAPDFCSVYVITKGKILSSKKAKRMPPSSAPQKTPSMPAVSSRSQQDNAELDSDGVRTQTRKRECRSTEPGGFPSDKVHDLIREPQHEGGRKIISNFSMESTDPPFSAGRLSTFRYSTSDASQNTGTFALAIMDSSAQGLDVSVASASSLNESNAVSAKLQSTSDFLEAEMRRLRLELKQTMAMYGTACKEALSAKKKATELNQWKVDEVRKFEETKLAGEAALAMAEMEKAKCRVAIEAAEKSQKLAEMEAWKRKQAEMKAERETGEKNRALNALAHNDVRYRRYTIEEIEEATDKFSPSNKIGEGGYGPVYKGKLDHTSVAIKALRPGAAQGKKQFQQEVEVLSTIRHPHMVLLLGACPEYGVLIYECMDNGSLEDRLLQKDNTPPIPWSTRFKIAAEIATALLFLHQTKPEPLVHRDLKPANILLDRNYVSKISDVGLARLVPPSIADSVTQYHMTSAAGTFCYIDPEYQQTGMLTTRSDIYSMGIMLLQIITAKPPMGLAHQVGRAIERGGFSDMLDQTVSDWPVEEALRFAILALKCAELRKRDRPSLATVIVPELNRLRDLGMNSEQQQSRGVSSRGRSCSPLRHPTSTSQAWMSNATQEKARTSCRGRTEQGSNQGDADGQES
ncbi:U-box domain-containing protein 52-like [Populus alba x Populus x berolinensis]|uniref:RING-type E3 ubiquitin transferase n=1 Tax=Populus alba x Populus x berolinensis TaxID=444605 RepID=A0AAD6QQA8_9ROSI|nr:U-box domain-containing protein 52-like [Populus alba x Populus x berolinensis]